MSDQQTDYQAPPGQSFDQQYAPHGNGEYHHAPPDPPEPIRPVLKLSEAAPRQSRAWPLAARLAVAVLIIGLATGFAMSLISIGTVSKRANQASQQAAAEAASVASLGRQLQALQAKVSVPAPAPRPYRPPAIYQHYGVCLTRTTDNATGDLANITLAAPVVTGGSYACPQGNLISVVPGG